MSRRRPRLTSDHARLLTLSTEPWLSCEDCFDLTDTYVEELLADSPLTAPAALEVHLTGCPACAEETESLLLLVAEQDGIDPAPALRRLPTGPADAAGRTRATTSRHTGTAADADPGPTRR